MRKITIIFGTITFTLCRNCCQFKYWKLSKPCTLWKFWFWQERSFRSGRSDDQNVSSQIYFALKKRRSSLVGKGNYSKCIDSNSLPALTPQVYLNVLFHHLPDGSEQVLGIAGLVCLHLFFNRPLELFCGSFFSFEINPKTSKSQTHMY
jgi:hypothetical protein